MYWEVIGNNIQGVQKASQIPPIGQTGVIKVIGFFFFFFRF